LEPPCISPNRPAVSSNTWVSSPPIVHEPILTKNGTPLQFSESHLVLWHAKEHKNARKSLKKI